MFRSVLAFGFILLLLQMCTWLQVLLPFYIPPALLGLFFLLLLLFALKRVPQSLLNLSRRLLPHLSLLFVPAILSIGMYKQQVAEHWPILLISLFLSTIFSLYLTAKFALYLQHRTAQKSEEQRGQHGHS